MTKDEFIIALRSFKQPKIKKISKIVFKENGQEMKVVEFKDDGVVVEFDHLEGLNNKEIMPYDVVIWGLVKRKLIIL